MAKLIENLPLYYRKSNFVKDVTTPIDEEILTISLYSDEIKNQFVVSSATDLSLQDYEKEYGLPINPQGITVEDRISRIKAKMRTAGIVTKDLIQAIVEAWANADVEVTENFANYSINVRFVNKLGIPPNINDVYKAVSEVIPAHLGITYEFKYRRHEELRPFTHAYLSKFSHTTIREGVI